MKFRVVLEYDEEEARQNIKEAIALYLEPSDIELPQDAKIAEVTVG